MTDDHGLTCYRCSQEERCRCGHPRSVHGFTCAGAPYQREQCQCRRFMPPIAEPIGADSDR